MYPAQKHRLSAARRRADPKRIRHGPATGGLEHQVRVDLRRFRQRVHVRHRKLRPAMPGKRRGPGSRRDFFRRCQAHVDAAVHGAKVLAAAGRLNPHIRRECMQRHAFEAIRSAYSRVAHLFRVEARAGRERLSFERSQTEPVRERQQTIALYRQGASQAVEIAGVKCGEVAEQLTGRHRAEPIEIPVGLAAERHGAEHRIGYPYVGLTIEEGTATRRRTGCRDETAFEPEYHRTARADIFDALEAEAVGLKGALLGDISMRAVQIAHVAEARVETSI
ncbi:hypothetical protein KCU90_g2308, partial [Aureobasidium melanogenum]